MSENSKLTPWIVWSLAVFFYFYQFIIRVATSNIQEPLTVEFHLTASEYGLFASFWLVSYALMQIPIGIALDKWGVKRVFMGSALVCGIGNLIMANAESFNYLCISRFLIGAGSSAAFIGAIKISSDWFKPSMLPILVGIMSGIGVIGASLAGAPLVILQNLIGWRNIFYILSLIAFALFGMYSFLLRDKKTSENLSLKEIKNQLLMILKEPQIWLLGMVGFLSYTPISVLADLWGPSFMSAVYGYNNIDSAILTSFVFYGNAVASFLCGWVFLKFRYSSNFFVFFIALSAIVMFAIIWMNLSNFLILPTALFLLGGMAAAENIVFSLGARYAAKEYHGLTSSVVNFVVMLGATALQPGIGIVMDMLWDGTLDNGVPAYSTSQYQYGLSALIGSLALGLILSLRIKGTTAPAKH